MADIVVCGGSVIGLATAMLLARDGHEVTVLERDGSELPASAEDAFERWDRVGVPQFRQPHNLLPGYSQILREELPEVLDGLVEAGGAEVDLLEPLPPSIADREARPGDERFRFVTGRRPMIEFVHARAAANEPGVTVRRGVKVESLLTGAPVDGLPHVSGVRCADGDVEADLVVDAMGRRSPLGDWLEAIGAPRPETHSQECRFTYYTRYFRGSELPARIGPQACPINTFMVLALPGDNSTWSVTLWAPNDDQPLKRFRDPEVFARVVGACPLYAHWLDGEPITDVLPMAGILDRHRRFRVDGQPLATGVAAVGDAWACTNPSAGRGLSVGLIHARRLRDVVRSHLDGPKTLVSEWDRVTETEVAPWYWNQLAADQELLSQIAAVREGEAETVSTIAPLPPEYEPATRAMPYDEDVFSAVMETLGCLALPRDVFDRPRLWDKVETAAGDPLRIPGPSRDELLTLLE